MFAKVNLTNKEQSALKSENEKMALDDLNKEFSGSKEFTGRKPITTENEKSSIQEDVIN